MHDKPEQQRKPPPMSDNEIVLQKLENGLLTITMNRPERRNASI
jgi:2-(1,2-epoxy-1,2-dihydrophenyl)acetyl-CoA isomerase